MSQSIYVTDEIESIRLSCGNITILFHNSRDKKGE